MICLMLRHKSLTWFWCLTYQIRYGTNCSEYRILLGACATSGFFQKEILAYEIFEIDITNQRLLRQKQVIVEYIHWIQPCGLNSP